MHTGKGSIDVSDATQESSAIGNTATGSVGHVSAPFAHHLRGAATPGEAPLVSGFVAKRGSKFPFAWAMRYCEVTVRHHSAHARCSHVSSLISPSSRPAPTPCLPLPQAHRCTRLPKFSSTIIQLVRSRMEPPRGQRQLKSMRLHGGVGSDACDGSGKSGDGDGYPILCLTTAGQSSLNEGAGVQAVPVQRSATSSATSTTTRHCRRRSSSKLRWGAEANCFSNSSPTPKWRYGMQSCRALSPRRHRCLLARSGGYRTD